MDRALKNNEKIYRISLAEDSAREMLAFLKSKEITYDLLVGETSIFTIMADEENKRKINRKLKEIGENRYLKYDKKIIIEVDVDNLIDEENVVEKYDYPNDEFDYTEEQKYISGLHEKIYHLEYEVDRLLRKNFPNEYKLDIEVDKKIEIKRIDPKKKVRLVGW